MGLNALGNNLLRLDLVNNHGGVVPFNVPYRGGLAAEHSADATQLLAFILLAVNAIRKLKSNPCILLGVGVGPLIGITCVRIDDRFLALLNGIVVGHIIYTAADQHHLVTVVTVFHTHKVVVKGLVQLLYTPVSIHQILERGTFTIDAGDFASAQKFHTRVADIARYDGVAVIRDVIHVLSVTAIP